MGFQEDQMIYKKVAIEFTNFLVNKNYSNAYNMLTEALQKVTNIKLLEKEMIDMTDYFEDPNNLWVDTKFVEEEGAIDNKCIYVPIVGNGSSEAVTVEIYLENEKQCIGSIEWGRP